MSTSCVFVSVKILSMVKQLITIRTSVFAMFAKVVIHQTADVIECFATALALRIHKKADGPFSQKLRTLRS